VQKTAEPIEMPFGIWTQYAGAMNHILDGGPDCHAKV